MLHSSSLISSSQQSYEVETITVPHLQVRKTEVSRGQWNSSGHTGRKWQTTTEGDCTDSRISPVSHKAQGLSSVGPTLFCLHSHHRKFTSFLTGELELHRRRKSPPLDPSVFSHLFGDLFSELSIEMTQKTQTWGQRKFVFFVY